MLKTSNNILEYSKRSLKQIEKSIIVNYKYALKEVRNKLLALDNKDALTQSDIRKYDRLNIMKKDIEVLLKDTQKSNYNLINKIRKTSYNNAYVESLKEFGIDISKMTEAIKASFNNPLFNANFSDSMKNLTKTDLTKISGEITNGLIQGKGVKEISKAIKVRVDMSASRAITIARTETLRSMSQGQIEATNKLVEKGFNVRKVWEYSYHIPLSRPEHEAMDGKMADEDGYFTLNNGIRMEAPRLSGDPAEDINCRCTYYNEIIEE
jgi:uncharacterized protein with gpF-like domain